MGAPRVEEGRTMLLGTRRRWTAALVVAGTVASACPARGAMAADDVVTPVVGAAITPPAQVLGADGLRHFAYELQLVNPAPLPVPPPRNGGVGGGQGRRPAARQAPPGRLVALGRAQAGWDARWGSGGRRDHARQHAAPRRGARS